MAYSSRTVGRRHLIAILLAVVLVGGATTPTAAREPPSTGGSVRWTPVDPAEIIGRASVPQHRVFSPSPFRTASYELRTLSWADLPMNGLSMMRLATPPNADKDGIPYKVVNGRNYYSPGNLAADGVRFVDSYVRTGDPAYLLRARVRAAKLRELGLVRDGALVFPYGFDYPTETLKAPWVSGYAQGFALSLFVRLFRVTGDWADLETAQAVFRSFRRLGPDRSLWVDYVVDRDLWLEEYPSRRPTHVLNGFNFALFGLYDYERLTREPAARQLLQGALSTLRRHAVSYRVPGEISYYDLVHRTQHAHYHEIHIWQLRDVAAITGDAYFGDLARQLASDYP